MVKKQEAATKKETQELLNMMFQIVYAMTVGDIMPWHPGVGTDLISHVSVVASPKGKVQLLVGGFEPWNIKGPAGAQLYKAARVAARKEKAKKATELEKQAADLRQDVEAGKPAKVRRKK